MIPWDCTMCDAAGERPADAIWASDDAHMHLHEQRGDGIPVITYGTVDA